MGYDLAIEDLKEFRQWASRTPGHPEHGETSGVETTTGPLGQGFGTAVGMALAERYLGAAFNGEEAAIVDHFTYVIAGDGDMMEGISHEAASLAGHQGLGKLVVLYDDNNISIDGSTELAFTEDVCARFEAYHWHVQRVEDGNDIEAIDRAIGAAKAEAGRPSLIAVRTHIGYGSPHKQDTAKAHGEALGEDEVRLTKENLGWPLEPTFFVPDEVRAFFAAVAARGTAAREAWDDTFAAWRAADQQRAATWDHAWARGLPKSWDEDLPVFAPDDGAVATRKASGAALDAVAARLPFLVGGSADLAPSNNTVFAGAQDQQAATPGGRYLRFGVREHAMAAAANGLVVHGGLRAYVATFFVFTDYLRPAMRIAALMQQPVIYVLTHDSIGLGEDGPTHQPVEHLAMVRATPNIVDLRPADANETIEAWKLALEKTDGPVALMLSRQSLPVLDRERYAAADGVRRGGYVLADAAGDETPDLVLIASGGEVAPTLAAHERLAAEGVASRLVVLASWELFRQQDDDYRERVLPRACRRRLAVEAATPFGWERWVGDEGEVLGVDRFGASAPGPTVLEQFGFTPETIYTRARELLAKGD
jgi:transketolase